MMLWSGFEVIRESFGIFMQFVPKGVVYDDVKQAILSFKEIGSVHDLHVWGLSSEDVVMSCHICLCKKTNTDTLITKIEKKLDKDFGIGHSTIQIEKEDICKDKGIVCR